MPDGGKVDYVVLEVRALDELDDRVPCRWPDAESEHPLDADDAQQVMRLVVEDDLIVRHEYKGFGVWGHC